ncbi:hypothetical protein [Saccharomonospora cyanea]|uniref:Phage protein, HK97 gp10 family n=1 Tax=Saccharomonospora cyanea NA-134 TaxID=882082 RepID=H5XG48_9PSEU|nr:hypothetical protein [Saccharomonospora cyanea]EHR62630.1 hypothetical protein SaccyDRAFT_3803 [Saccharomonospora cyanea NA-134]
MTQPTPPKKTALTLNLAIDNVKPTLAAFRKLPKEANNQLRERSKALAELVATRIKAAGLAEGKQAALVARTVKARRDRVPVVQAGGTKKLGRHQAPAYSLLFGSEFGMNQRTGWYAAARYQRSIGYQYHPHTGRQGAWFFPTAEAQQPMINREWNAAADEILRAFAGGA